jgi:hypothetical protein
VTTVGLKLARYTLGVYFKAFMAVFLYFLFKFDNRHCHFVTKLLKLFKINMLYADKAGDKGVTKGDKAPCGRTVNTARGNFGTTSDFHKAPASLDCHPFVIPQPFRLFVYLSVCLSV